MRKLLLCLIALGACASGCSSCDTPAPADCSTDADCSHGPCSEARCAAGICEFTALSPGAPCDGGVCDKSLACVACREDGLKNDQETDVDCGGPGCPQCETGQDCSEAGDCATGVCKTGDCADGACIKKCVEPTCIDSIKDGTESDVDCGGACKFPCDYGKKCNTSADCKAAGAAPGGVCKNGVCCAVPCDGSCTMCAPGSGACVFVPKGSDGGGCAGAGDACDGMGHCYSCVDQTMNYQETGVDCGGGVCPRCSSADGSPCKSSDDCDSCICEAGKCSPPKCSNGEKDPCETDTDCGGPCGATCGLGMACLVKGDCFSNRCENGACAAP